MIKKPRVTLVCSWMDIVRKVQETIVHIALISKDAKGEEKLDQVVETVAEWADAQIQFRPTLGGRIAERVDGLVCRGLIRVLAQFEFDSLRASGKV